MTAIRALRTWDPRVGVPFRAYAWLACVRHLQRYLLRIGAPVTATGERTKHLRDVRAIELDDYVDLSAGADERLDDHRWRERANDRLSFLFYRHGPTDARVATRMLLDEEKPAVVAAETGIPVTRVYRIACRTRRHLASSASLFRLHNERNEPS